MKKMSMIGAALIGAAMLSAAPISLHQSQENGLSLSLNKAYAQVVHPAARGVARRTMRRAVRRCATGVTC